MIRAQKKAGKRASLRGLQMGDCVRNVIFPRRCPSCDEPVRPFGRLICTTCAGDFVIPSGASCFRCGKPLPDENSEAEYCRDCLERDHAFDRGYSLFLYKSVARSLYRFKYAGRQEYADYYADRFVRLYAAGRHHLYAGPGRGLTAQGMEIEALVPVPLHKKRLQKRGFNQSEAFAEALSARTGVPVLRDLVKRIKNTLPMKELDSEGRRNNLKNAFIMGRNDVLLSSVAIVDDIYTTGSTVDAIAALLRQRGIRFVYVITIAVGMQ